MTSNLCIPGEVDIALKIGEKEKESFLLRELAVSLYHRGGLSFGKARELAGMTKWDFYDEPGQKGIPRHYTIRNFKEDLLYGKEKGDLKRAFSSGEFTICSNETK